MSTVNKVDQAEQVILKFMEREPKRFKNLTTSKLRNILSIVTDMYNEVRLQRSSELNEDLQRRIQLLRIRLVYECGREPAVKCLVEQAGLLADLNRIGKSKDEFLSFAHYMEALVAYHRFHGGRE